MADTELAEEDSFPWYTPDQFYPIRIGDIFKSRYEIIGKLGYGGYSTVWLCRDFLSCSYVALKVCRQCSPVVQREVLALRHLKSLATSPHPGSPVIRKMLDEFEIQNSDGTFQCFVHEPMSISMNLFRQLLGGTLNEDVLRGTLKRLLFAVDYLHSVAEIIHTDVQESNILFSIEGDSDLVEFEKEEKNNPSRRKIVGDRIIFESRDLFPNPDALGRPMLCDFGEARLMKDVPYLGLIQPRQYRAPEVILCMPWDEKVDIWSIGVMIWDMFYGHNLFNYRGPEGEPSTTYHLAQMVALLGPPPTDFLRRSTSDELRVWFDEEGNWKASIPVPDTSLEEADTRLEGEEKARFLKFIRKMLKWKPEERSSARELLEDDWLTAASK